MAQRDLSSHPDLASLVMEGITTGRHLGTGSYGSVEEIDISGLLCAGKRLHRALLESSNHGAQEITRKYVQECKLMSTLHHPNITQFMGVCFLPNCNLPLLVMEKLEGSLDDFIETVPNISIVLKRSILEDIARGMVYMHKHNPQVVHRDLTARNILLTTSLVAKITDFGNSRIINIPPGQLAQTLSRVPGTPLYMPPEALSSAARYGPSLDVFSFGHLALFTLTQLFPNNLLDSTYPDPDNPNIVLGRSEVERRKEYIMQLEKQLPDGEHNPLTHMVKQCFQNVPQRRPTAEHLVFVLEGARDDIEGPFGKLTKLDAIRRVIMMKELMARDAEVKERISELETKDAQIHELQKQVQDIQLQLQEKDILLRQTTALLHSVQNQLHLCQSTEESPREEILQKGTDNQKLQRELTRCKEQLQGPSEGKLQHQDEQTTWKNIQSHLSESRLPLKLEWKCGKGMPHSMCYYPLAIVLERKVFIGGGTSSNSEVVMVYNIDKDEWSVLPPYPYFWFGMTSVNNRLILVGGVEHRSENRTNQLGVWDEKIQQWSHHLPPMVMARSGPTVVTYKNRWVVTAGGYDTADKVHSSVEILDICTGYWYRAPRLPLKQYKMSSALIGNMWYLLGGFYSHQQALCVCIDTLIHTAILQPNDPSPWRIIPYCPCSKSTALNLNGALLAVGGKPESNAIYFYQHSSERWVKAGELPTAKWECSCAVLPGGELFVAGGHGSSSENEVYMGILKN